MMFSSVSNYILLPNLKYNCPFQQMGLALSIDFMWPPSYENPENVEEYYFGMGIFIAIIAGLFFVICLQIYFWVLVNSFRKWVNDTQRIQPESQQLYPGARTSFQNHQPPIFVTPGLPNQYPQYQHPDIYRGVALPLSVPPQSYGGGGRVIV